MVGGDATISTASTTFLPGVLANATASAKTTTSRLLDALRETVGNLLAVNGSDADANADHQGYNGSAAFEYGGRFSRLVLNATGQLYENEFINDSGVHSGSSNDGTIITGSSNQSYSEMPQIPEYIRATSMVFCIIIMCLGVIGNIMVS